MTVQFSPSDAEISAHTILPSSQAQKSPSVYRNYVKRGLDIFLTLLAAPIVLPSVALMALMIALDGHNPFYSQMRVGQNGRNFRMWKLRTMVHNADQLLEQYLSQNPAARQEWDATQKLKKDPRITWLGSVLRKTSMDELTQLWNVLNGTMSLVGPRPIMVSQRKGYVGTAYYNLRPGITGLWQISERNECAFGARVGFDEAYEKSIALKTDLWILLSTVRVVLRGTGY